MTFLSILGTLLYYLAIALFLESTFNYFMYDEKFNNSQANCWDLGFDHDIDQASNPSVNTKNQTKLQTLSQEKRQDNTKKRLSQHGRKSKVQKKDRKNPKKRSIKKQAEVKATEPFPEYQDPFLCLRHPFWEEHLDWEDTWGHTERRRRADGSARHAARHMARAFGMCKANSTTRWKPPATSWMSRIPSTSFYLRTLNKHHTVKPREMRLGGLLENHRASRY